MEICLLDGNVVQTRTYLKNKIVGENKKFCKDFEEGIAAVETMIEGLNKKYDVKEVPQDGPAPPRGRAAAKQVPQPMLGKRGAAAEKAGQIGTKRVKVDEPIFVAPAEEVKLGTRRSERNVGKEANYNIDDIIDAGLEDKGKTGTGCINVMLA
jgi:hypothetical protein